MLTNSAQAALHVASLLSVALQGTSPVLSGVLLLASLCPFSGLKKPCLHKGGSPLALVLADWRRRVSDAVRTGLPHHLYCMGCCGVLMALLSAHRFRNWQWLGALVAIVLIEEIYPDLV